MNTINLFQTSDTILSLVQTQSHTLRSDGLDRVNDGVSICRDHHDCGFRFGTIWHAHRRSS